MTKTNNSADSLISSLLIVTGRFPDNDYPDWVVQRALKLNLAGWVKRRDDSCVEIMATGHRVLVEALEAACNLGPTNASVDSITLRPGSSTGDGSTFIDLSE